MPLAEGVHFAGYTVVRFLGAGGMGEVYLARHARLPRNEALKILRADVSADPDYRQRFEREADSAARLWHPHIVGVHDRGEFDEQLWIAMDYVDGPDLAALLRTPYATGMPAGEAIAVITAVADALDYAHHRGLMHRDVKPANILIGRPDDGGSAGRILLSDFGIARALDDISGLTATNMVVGTADYGAPEQLMGHPCDHRADQYALAATAYHLLTGHPPFPRPNSVAVISAHLTAPPPRPSADRPELAPLDEVFARGLAKHPAERFGGCAEFAAALTERLQHCPTGAPPRPGAPWSLAPTAARDRPPLPEPAAATTPPPPYHDGAPPVPQRRGPRWWIRGRPAAAAVSAAAAVVLAVVVIPRLGEHHRAPPADLASYQGAARQAGRDYLQALARGDAAAALALSAAPPGRAGLLTDDVLRAQVAAVPITDIEVRSAPEAPGANPADAQYLILSARFGPTASQTRIGAHRVGGGWKLDATTVAVAIGTATPPNASLKAVAVWGVATHGVSPVTVFPGAVAVSSANRYIDISAPTTAVLLDALTDTGGRARIAPVATLNDTGRQTAKTAIDDFIHHCHHGTAPPPDCLQPSSGTNYPTITGPGDFAATTFTFDAATMLVAVGGRATYHGTSPAVPNYTLITDVLGTVDLTRDPPTFTRTAVK